MRKQILEILRGYPHISGEEISRRLHISRAAVAKHVKALRLEGYHINAVTGKGYEFICAPDKLLPAEIAGHLPLDTPWRLQYIAETTSTNILLREMAEAGAPEYTALIAESQNAGQGRLDRSWHSPPGEAMFLSVLLRPKIPPQVAQTMTLTAACAVQETLADFDIYCFIKWPNDILSANGLKLCGIKTEMRADMDSVAWLITGIGLNINNALFPAELTETATSLRLITGKSMDRTAVTAAVLRHLAENYQLLVREGFAPIRDKWKHHASMLGKEVTVDNNGIKISGIALDLNEMGHLLIEQKDGQVITVTTGDVNIGIRD
ncbi:MAG: biotin--[acetyl-CoA-carboxylase] ligase [Clostridiales bacterium]|nr:biotin--[acetyl-CoA-carboxylase] ligase [Clostridiales bacterium]